MCVRGGWRATSGPVAATWCAQGPRGRPQLPPVAGPPRRAASRHSARWQHGRGPLGPAGRQFGARRRARPGPRAARGGAGAGRGADPGGAVGGGRRHDGPRRGRGRGRRRRTWRPRTILRRVPCEWRGARRGWRRRGRRRSSGQSRRCGRGRRSTRYRLSHPIEVIRINFTTHILNIIRINSIHELIHELIRGIITTIWIYCFI